VALFKKGDPVATAKAAKSLGGRPLLMYFVPVMVIGVILMLMLAILAQQSIRNGATETARNAAEGIAGAIAARLESAVQGRRQLLQLALADGRGARALEGADADALQTLQAELQGRIPGVVQLRLLGREVNHPDPSGPAPLGYAGLEMIRSTIASGSPSLAEVHQIESGVPYLAMAVPVSADSGVVGALFAAWDLRLVNRLVETAPAMPGQLQLRQGGSKGFVLARGPGASDFTTADGRVAVSDSIWEVAYVIEPQTGALGDLATLLLIVVAGAAVLLAVSLLQWRALGRDLRVDMGAILNLGEAILRGDATATVHPRLANTGDALALLSQYARDARATPAGGRLPGAKPVAVRAGDAAPPPHGLDVTEIDSDPAEFLAGAQAGRTPGAPVAEVDIAESLFRAYDIRGIVGDTLNAGVAELLGRAVATLVQEQGGRSVAVARDARLSSPELAEALVRGLTGSGCDVLDIGQAPTPLLYFAIQTQPVQAGVMVTGSHNPPEYNGFKIVVGDRVIDGAELLALREQMGSGVFAQGNGSVERVDLLSDYIEAVTREVQLARPLKVVVDAGNGVAGDLAIATLEALGCEVVPVFCEPDGTFPNHHPDPSQPDNLASLILEVEAQEADIGIALDGDGDRLGVVDERGNLIWPDRLLMLLAADVLGRHPGVDIIYDVKSSRHLASFVLSHGGRPIMWRSGHSRMRAKMLETGALLGGEFSGHLFIKERWYGFDDAIYAAARLLEIMALESRPASELFSEIPDSPASPEYQLMLEEGQSEELMRALDPHKMFDDARLVELDGLRVEFAEGWGLIRPSNTTPSLTFRFEADDERALEEIKSRFRGLLERVAPDLEAPF
jgi:phosphomannomutase/phosphoglucomutase